MSFLRYISLVTIVTVFTFSILYKSKIKSYIEGNIPQFAPAEFSQQAKVKKQPQAKPKLNHSELDNSKIDEILSRQAPSLKRCHQNRISDVGTLKGVVLLGVTILPTGLVADVSLLKSNISDPTLIQCLIRVMQRAKFPKYQGGAKQRAFPIEFQ